MHTTITLELICIREWDKNLWFRRMSWIRFTIWLEFVLLKTGCSYFFLYLSYTKKCSSNIYERLFINNQFLLARFDANFFFYMIKLRIPCGRDAPSVVSFMWCIKLNSHFLSLSETFIALEILYWNRCSFTSRVCEDCDWRRLFEHQWRRAFFTSQADERKKPAKRIINDDVLMNACVLRRKLWFLKKQKLKLQIHLLEQQVKANKTFATALNFFVADTDSL